MFDNWRVDGKDINRPIDADRLKITLEFDSNSIAETQPVIDFDTLNFHTNGLEAILQARERVGPYRMIPIEFDYSNFDIFKGYLTDLNFLLDRDEIEAKPVSFDSTDALSELLSAIDMALLKDEFIYQDLEFVVESVDIRGDLLNLNLSGLFYYYVLYTQIKEISRLAARAIEAAGNAAGLSFGTALALALEIIAQGIFIASTIIQLVNYAKSARELTIPPKRITKVITLFELLRAPLDRIGYKLRTEFPEMLRIVHWASGDVTNNEYYPRSTDRCGTALGALSFILEKFAAQVAVRDKTVFIYSKYRDTFDKNTNFVLEDFIENNYRENLDDMVGTREIVYSVDYNDEWTLKNFKGTELKIRANINTPALSTIKGYEPTEYGVALCNRKDELNRYENQWNSFAGLVDAVLSVFGGSAQNLKVDNRIGVAKISSEQLSIAKVVWPRGSKLPFSHRVQLSALSDEIKYHWVKSHVRNPRAKTRIYEGIPMRYNDISLQKNLDSSRVNTINGVRGRLNKVEWEFDRDEALLSFEIEDVNRDTRLTETFEEPEK